VNIGEKCWLRPRQYLKWELKAGLSHFAPSRTSKTITSALNFDNGVLFLMIIECLTCERPIIGVRASKRKDDGTTTATMQCGTCGAIFALEIRELRPSPQPTEWIESRRNRTT
jgi:hypothetical protein